VKADYVEQIVIDYVLAALEHTDIATARARRAGGDAHQLVASIETDEQFLADLAADYGAQRINRTQFLSAQDPVHARLLLARRRLDQLTIDPSLDDTACEGVTADSWDRLDLDQQRALVGPFVAHGCDPERQAWPLLRPQSSPPGTGRERRLRTQPTAPSRGALATFDGPPWRGPERRAAATLVIVR
jgi:hypothetical protein